jgi:hypothetical protein
MLVSFLLSIWNGAVKWLLARKVAQFERDNHYDMGYARAMLDANPGALITLHRAGAMAQYRGPLPASAHFGARLVAALHDDCGPCLQLGVTMALRAGVPNDVVTHILCDEPTGDGDVDLVVHFSRSVLSKAADESELREQIVQRFGQDGLTAIALSIAGVRIYPMLKAVLGYAECYPSVQVGTRSVPLPRAQALLTQT